MSYDEYLNTSHWNRVKKSKLRETGNRCEDCGRLVNPIVKRCVRHLNFKAVGREGPKDVIVLCDGCEHTRHLKHQALKPAVERFENA